MNRDAPLPQDVEALLQHERAIPPPPPGAFARVQTRLHETIAVGTARVPRGPIGGSPTATKLIITVVLGVLATGAIISYVAMRHEDAPVTVPARASAPAPPAVVPPPSPPPATAPSPPPPPVPAVKKAEPRVVKSERELLDEAQRCLAQQTTACALAAVATHERYYPGGALSEERDAIRVQALAAAGKTASAHERARSFLVRYPNSIHAAVVRHVLDE